MAYMSQEMKKALVEQAKPILKKYGVKATFSVDNHRSLVCTIKSGPIDFIWNFNQTCGNDYYQTARGWTPVKDYIQVNPYHYNKHFSGRALEFLRELIPVLNSQNYDNSQIEYDYFDVGYYLNVHVGRWNKPYKVEA